MQSQQKEHRREVDVSDDIIDKQMTKYRDNKESDSLSSSTSVMPYQLQFVTLRRDQKPDDLSWLYDTPGLYSKNQVHARPTNQMQSI